MSAVCQEAPAVGRRLPLVGLEDVARGLLRLPSIRDAWAFRELNARPGENPAKGPV